MREMFVWSVMHAFYDDGPFVTVFGSQADADAFADALGSNGETSRVITNLVLTGQAAVERIAEA